ncbi:MAG: hypothetical protein Kow0027_13360 [Saprospiraceae bacterium]
MPHRPNLFEEFPPVSKAEWLEKIKQDLKGKAIEALDWQVGSLKVSPFHHLDDRKDHSTALAKNAGWLLGEDIPAHDLTAANKLAHKALAAGAESLQFFIDEPLGDHRLEGLLEGVNPAETDVRFYEANKNASPAGLQHHLHHLVNKRKLAPASVRGAINWSEEATVVQDDLEELLRFAMEHLPAFRVLPVNVKAQDDPAEELRSMLEQLDHWLVTMTQAGFSAQAVLNHSQVLLTVNSNYFVSLCKFRAARMLFHHLAEVWKAPAGKPFFDAAFVAYPQGDSPYNNLIQATTQAISAIAGGADRLTVLPADVQNPAKEEGSPTFRRMARNLHHILRSESYMQAVADPAAGSYFFEDLTEKLAAETWRRFTEGK